MRYILMLFLFLVVIFFSMQYYFKRISVIATSFCFHVRDLDKVYHAVLNMESNKEENELPITFLEKTLVITYDPNNPQLFFDNSFNLIHQIKAEYVKVFPHNCWFSKSDWERVERAKDNLKDLEYLMRNDAWKRGFLS